MNTRKFHLPGEAALLLVLMINPLAIDLMSKSAFGISTISSVPLIFSTAFPIFSFGTWNYIFQTLLVITLMVLKRSFCPGYLFSFVVGIGFGKMIDVHNAWVTMLPIVPTDIFPRDLSELLHKKYHRIKTTFDLTCLITTVLLSLLILHHLYGIGIGTFFCAFMTGRTVALVQKFVEKHVDFYRLAKKRMVLPGNSMRHA